MELFIFKVIAQIEIPEDSLVIPKNDLGDPSQSRETVTTILSLAFGVLGSAAFVIMVLAGMKFVLSRGSPDAVAKARNTIIYAAAGVVLSMLSFAIVRFVIRGLL